MWPKAHPHKIEVFQGIIHIGGVDAKLDDIAEIHACPFEDRLKIVQGQTDLRAHIARMLGGAVLVHSGLTCADHPVGLRR